MNYLSINANLYPDDFFLITKRINNVVILPINNLITINVSYLGVVLFLKFIQFLNNTKLGEPCLAK